MKLLPAVVVGMLIIVLQIRYTLSQSTRRWAPVIFSSLAMIVFVVILYILQP